MVAPKSKAKVQEMKKGPWTRDEDQKLLAFIQQHGHGSWRTLPQKAGLERCGKSCRLRWTNYLRPDIKRGKFSTHEEKSIIRLHALLGNRWSVIAAHLPKRTDNEIKNYWNTRLKKRLTRMGIDPATHKPKNNPVGSAHSKHAATLSHLAQWETTRLEAEARLARESKLVSNLQLLQRATAPPPLLPAPAPCLDVLKVWQSSTLPTCFFSSTATLDSPTSTLNFSAVTVPTVCPIKEKDVVPMNNYGACGGVGQAECYSDVKGETENSLYDHNDVIYPVGYDCEMMMMMMGSMDHASFNHDFGEYEINYWNDLLDLATSTMESPTL